jgi:uncharacterized membrane protein
MGLERNLARWVEAGILDQATSARIAEYEATRHKPVALYAMLVLGASTVALGIISTVAANWEYIPATLKLAVDLVLGAGLAGAAWFALSQQRHLLSEVLVTLLYGYTLASLALVGQIYQLGTPTYQALLAWSASTAPLFLLVRSRYAAALWVVGLATTHVLSLDALFDHLTQRWGGSDPALLELMITLSYASPLLYVGLSRVPWLLRERSELALTLGTWAWTAVLALGFGVQLLWYDRIDLNARLDWSLFATLVLSGVSIAAVPRLYPDLRPASQRALSLILGFAWLSLALAAGYERPALGFVAALMQVLWLSAFAWLSLSLGMLRAFNLLTGFIALRVLFVYFEVFGSLLDTGLGLISGGVLTLLIAWFWRNRTRALTHRLRERGGRHGA